MVGIYQLKPGFQRSLKGLEDRCVAADTKPDSLTYAALALSCLGGFCLYLGPSQPLLLLVVPLVAIGRTVLNALDGLVARRTGRARPWGDVLNEGCDRLADLAMLGGAALAAGVNHHLGAAAIVAVLLSSHLAVVSKAAGGPRQHGGPMGKADRMVLLAALSPLGLVLSVATVYDLWLGLVLIGALVTLGVRLRATYRDLEPAG